VCSSDLTPYGKLAAHDGTADTLFHFNGLYGVVDDEDSLLYMRARYYSVDLLRFTNADILTGTLKDPATLNRYAFANGNPVLYIDPFGRSATLIAGAHTALDAAGLIPGFGMIFDGVNLIWYAVEGDYVNAGLSAIGFVPIAGNIAGGARLGVKVVRAVDAGFGARGLPMGSRYGVLTNAGSSARNAPANINGVQYVDHAVDQMQNRGILPSVAENTLRNGTPSPGHSGRIQYYDEVNNVTVITESYGDVVTVRYGK
jgi:RHS repeat-associated protein